MSKDAPSAHARETANDGTGFYIRTFMGYQFFWHRIKENEYDIRDIAHALSMNCRWTGHVKRFYSVAEHCYYASMQAPDPHKLGALLHDASEAYVHDMPSPLKWFLAEKGFTAMKDLEDEIDETIFKRFGVPYPVDPAIKLVDQRLLATEHRDLMPENSERKAMKEPYVFPVMCYSPEMAEQLYLKRFQELTV
jgi:hypothetical protein